MDEQSTQERSFDWTDLSEEAEELEDRFGAPHWSAEHGQWDFLGAPSAVALLPPLILPSPQAGEALADWLERLDEGDLPGKHLVILMQAGAAAIAVFDEGEAVLHKVLKRYVVRGTGRAQPAHLKTRGKSRYGSRLRLQNAQRLLDEVNERLTLWWDREAPFDRCFRSVPVRLWSDLTTADDRAPPGAGVDFDRIPLDVHRPCFEELLRVYRFLCRGRVRQAQRPPN